MVCVVSVMTVDLFWTAAFECKDGCLSLEQKVLPAALDMIGTLLPA
jgi:hypothetical protein